MTRDEFNRLLPLKAPAVIAVCPICGDCIYIDGVDEWYEEDGQMRIDPQMGGVSLDCGSAPDIDSDDFDEWMNGHWSTPYIDWLPIQQKVTRWFAQELVQPDTLKHLMELAVVEASNKEKV
jgi:hypothetical protein